MGGMKMGGGMMGMMPPMGGRALDQVLMQLLSGGEIAGPHRLLSSNCRTAPQRA